MTATLKLRFRVCFRMPDSAGMEMKPDHSIGIFNCPKERAQGMNLHRLKLYAHTVYPTC